MELNKLLAYYMIKITIKHSILGLILSYLSWLHINSHVLGSNPYIKLTLVALVGGVSVNKLGVALLKVLRKLWHLVIFESILRIVRLQILLLLVIYINYGLEFTHSLCLIKCGDSILDLLCQDRASVH